MFCVISVDVEDIPALAVDSRDISDAVTVTVVVDVDVVVLELQCFQPAPQVSEATGMDVTVVVATGITITTVSTPFTSEDVPAVREGCGSLTPYTTIGNAPNRKSSIAAHFMIYERSRASISFPNL